MFDSSSYVNPTPLAHTDTLRDVLPRGEVGHLGVVRDSHLSSPSTNLTRGLVARRLFKVPPCREGTIHLQTSMSSPGFEPSPNGTAGCPSGIIVSDAGCCAVGPGFESGKDMDVCKYLVPLRDGDTINSRRAASPLVRLVEEEGR
ncbi:hypothetical protein TNCV_4895821 [Trichonephila clavipes]|nr:hypothetical protein TNCV_4895821 [Trichonephila clavipes]